MSVSTRDKVHNQFCREPGAGKPHAGICAGVRLARGVSTHQKLPRGRDKPGTTMINAMKPDGLVTAYAINTKRDRFCRTEFITDRTMGTRFD